MTAKEKKNYALNMTDNIIIHSEKHDGNYVGSPYIFKCVINGRIGKRIVWRLEVRDMDCAVDFVSRNFPDIPFRKINHDW